MNAATRSVKIDSLLSVSPAKRERDGDRETERQREREREAPLSKLR